MKFLMVMVSCCALLGCEGPDTSAFSESSGPATGGTGGGEDGQGGDQSSSAAAETSNASSSSSNSSSSSGGGGEGEGGGPSSVSSSSSSSSSAETASSSSGGDEGGAGGGDEGGAGAGGEEPSECTSGETRCDGDSVEVCSNGEWSFSQTCPFVCEAGSCEGVCEPGDQRCDGDNAQSCDDNGEWVTDEACPLVCSNGECVGSCDPGDTQCSGDTAQVCNDQGTWTNTATCPFLCDNGACTGVCEPGDERCSGNGTETCQADGTWGSAASCPDLPGSNPTCAGDAECGFSCDQGFANCNNGSGCETTLGTTANCLGCGDSCGAPPANAASTCTADGCGFSCLTGWDDCDGNPANGCETSTEDDEWNCGGCDIACYGGTCSNSACDSDIEKVSEVGNITSMTLGTNFGRPEVYFTRSNSSVNKAPSVGGQTTVLASNEHTPVAITTDGTRVIWSSTETAFKAVRSVPPQGGSVTDIVTGHAPLDLTHDGVNLYWTDQTAFNPCFCSTIVETNIMRMGLGGGVPQVVNTFTMGTSRAFASWPGVVVENNRVHRIRWKNTASDSDVVSVSLSNAEQLGQTATTIGSGYFTQARHLTRTPTGYIVFSARLAPSGGRGIIKANPTQGGNQTTLTTIFDDGAQVRDLVADDTHAYVSVRENGFAYDRIYRVTMSTQVVDIVADFQVNASNLEVDATHVYWSIDGIRNGAQTQGVPTIVRFTK